MKWDFTSATLESCSTLYVISSKPHSCEIKWRFRKRAIIYGENTNIRRKHNERVTGTFPSPLFRILQNDRGRRIYKLGTLE